MLKESFQKRGLKLSGFTTFRLLSLVGLLDKLVFPEDPIPIVIIAKNKHREDPTSPFLCYAYDSCSGRERYEVFESLDDRIKDVLKTRRHIYFNDVLKLRTLGRLQPVSEDEFLVGLAAHEVRHRVQRCLKINLLLPEDERKAKDPDIRVLLIFATIMMKEKRWDSLPNFSKEYDAYVVELLAARKYHEGCKFGEIAELIKTDAKKIIGDVIPDFLFITFYFNPPFQNGYNNII
jgi:hypothetical protein